LCLSPWDPNHPPPLHPPSRLTHLCQAPRQEQRQRGGDPHDAADQCCEGPAVPGR
jgi:hypothetical protein